jgi:DNA topoisomerase 2-associated protein PAT1
LESIWDDKSPLSFLHRATGAGRVSDQKQISTSSTFSPFSDIPGFNQKLHRQGINQTGVRSLQEIESEMRTVAHQSQAPRRQGDDLFEYQRQQEQEKQFLLRQQQQQLLQQQQQLQQQQLLQQQQHQRTPPPRMLPVSQSPRFHERQHQILLLQQQQELQQQQQLQQLHEQLQLEELERRLRAQQLSQMRQSPSQYPQRHSPNQFNHQRASSGSTLVDFQATQMQHRQQSPVRSPARNGDGFQVPVQQDLSYLPQSIQLQQRLLAEMANAEFVHHIQGATPPEQEALRMEAMRKIMETERMEERRRRKAAKIAHMVGFVLTNPFNNTYPFHTGPL